MQTRPNITRHNASRVPTPSRYLYQPLGSASPSSSSPSSPQAPFFLVFTTDMSFGGFGTNQQQTGTTGGGMFGGTFGSTQNTATPAAGGSLFGNPNTAQQVINTGGGMFGATNTNQQAGGTTGGGLFGSTQPTGGLFGNTNTNTNQQQQQPAGGMFGNTGQQTAPSGGLFGSTAQTGECRTFASAYPTKENKDACTLGKVQIIVCKGLPIHDFC